MNEPDNLDVDTTQDADRADSGCVSSEEVETHRNALGEVMKTLADKGIDIDQLAQEAGLPHADVDQLEHADLGRLTCYIASNHPEVLESVTAKFPACKGVVEIFTTGSGMLSGLFGGAKAQQSS